MQLKGAPRRHLQAARGKGAGPATCILDQALLHWRKINGLHQVEVAAPEGEVEASPFTNVAFWSLLLSSLCYFSLLQICLDVRTPAWAAAQRGRPGGGSLVTTWGTRELRRTPSPLASGGSFQSQAAI